MRTRSVGCRSIGASIVPPAVITPRQMASYSRWISRASSMRTSAVCAASVRATTSRPLVSLSSRCTMPARGSAASCGSCASSAFCSVRSGLPAPGCTTSPAGLSMTNTCWSRMHDRQRDRLRFGLGRRPRRSAATSHLLAAVDLVPRPARRAVDEYLAGVDPGLEPAARIIRQQRRQRLVEALPRLVGGNLQAQADGGSRHGVEFYILRALPPASAPGFPRMAVVSFRSLAVAVLAVALLASAGCSSLKFWDKDDGDKVIQGSPEQHLRRGASRHRRATTAPARSSATRCSRRATRSANRPSRASST